MSARTRCLGLRIQRENDMVERLRKSELRLMVALDTLRQIEGTSKYSTRARRLATAAIQFIEHSLA